MSTNHISSLRRHALKKCSEVASNSTSAEEERRAREASTVTEAVLSVAPCEEAAPHPLSLAGRLKLGSVLSSVTSEELSCKADLAATKALHAAYLAANKWLGKAPAWLRFLIRSPVDSENSREMLVNSFDSYATNFEKVAALLLKLSPHTVEVAKFLAHPTESEAAALISKCTMMVVVDSGKLDMVTVTFLLLSN